MKVVIIGGSTAGMGVASKLRRNLPDAEIVVYQKEKYVSLGACGLPYYIEGHFQNPYDLIARSILEFEKANIKIHPEVEVQKVNFDTQEVCFENEQGQVKTDNYDQLVITVGAQPIIPPIKGITAKNVFAITRIEDAVAIKNYLNESQNVQNIAIIGSGFIGLEMCEALQSLKKEVIIVEMESALISRLFDVEITSKIEETISSKKGVKIFKGDGLKEVIVENDIVKKIYLQSGTEQIVDAVILAIGFKPATDFLKNSALKMEKNGAIIVDNQGRTNCKNVWSCGDCATSLHQLTQQNTYTALATVPRKFAKIVADNIAGANKKYAGTLQTSIIKVFDLEAARTGLTEKQAQSLGYDYRVAVIEDLDHPTYYPNAKPLTLKVIMDQKTKTLIGAQIAGQNKAVLRIHSLIALIWNKTIIDDSLEQIDLPYAPPFSRPVDIIHLALSKLNKN